MQNDSLPLRRTTVPEGSVSRYWAKPLKCQWLWAGWKTMHPARRVRDSVSMFLVK